MTTIHWTVVCFPFENAVSLLGASLRHILSTILLLSFPIHPFQNTKFWRKSTNAWVWDCDILNMTSFEILEMPPLTIWHLWNGTVTVPSWWKNHFGKISCKKGFSSSRVHICWICWIMCEVGRHTLLVIYYLLSSWPVVWPPLLLLGRGEDSTPAFISGNGEGISLWNFSRSHVALFRVI